MAKVLSQTQHDSYLKKVKYEPRKPKRAVAFGGGGPAVGVSVGFLLAMEEWNERMENEGHSDKVLKFPIWISGCVGGWLNCLYHISKSPKAKNTEALIKTFFRQDDMYESFPAPMTFTPDIPEQIAASLKFMVDKKHNPFLQDNDIYLQKEINKSYVDILNYFIAPSRWSQGDFAYLMLNSMFAPSPASRWLMGLLYKSEIPGLNKIWFGPDYNLLKQLDLNELNGIDEHLYFNSYNIDKHKSQIYSNKPAARPGSKKTGNSLETSPPGTHAISMPALCASSALPYILQPVKLDDKGNAGDQWTHMEGALIDSFCFEAIHDHHEDINEIWISQIVDHKQVKAPKNLLEALNNLIMLYAGTTSRHDIEVFANDMNRHDAIASLVDAKHKANPLEILRLPVEETTNYFWSFENFENSVTKSKKSCLAFIANYFAGCQKDGNRVSRHENIFVRSSQWT